MHASKSGGLSGYIATCHQCVTVASYYKFNRRLNSVILKVSIASVYSPGDLDGMYYVERCE